MATKVKENGVQAPSLEARFPIVATNLRALVSSWLPPAREPSPVDEEISVNGENEGRQERYHHRLGRMKANREDWHLAQSSLRQYLIRNFKTA